MYREDYTYSISNDDVKRISEGIFNCMVTDQDILAKMFEVAAESLKANNKQSQINKLQLENEFKDLRAIFCIAVELIKKHNLIDEFNVLCDEYYND